MKTLLAIRTAQLSDATKLSDLVKRNIYQYHIGHYSKMELGVWEKGYGKILLEFVLGRSRSNGLKYHELESNEWVIPFYEKFHFRNTRKITVTWEGHPFVEYKMVREL